MSTTSDATFTPTGHPVRTIATVRYRTDLDWADVVLDGRTRSHLVEHPLPDALPALTRMALVRVPVEDAAETWDGGYGAPSGLTMTSYVLYAETYASPHAKRSDEEVTHADGAVLTRLEFPDGFTAALATSFQSTMPDFASAVDAVWNAYATHAYDGFGATLTDPDALLEQSAQFERGTWVQARAWRDAVCDPDRWFAADADPAFVTRPLPEEGADETFNAAFVLNDYASHGFTSRAAGDAFVDKTLAWEYLTEAIEVGFNINTPAGQEWVATALNEEWHVIQGLRVVRMAARDGWTPPAFQMLQPRAVMDSLWARSEQIDEEDDRPFLEMWSDAVGYRAWMKVARKSGYRAALYVMAGLTLSEAQRMVEAGEEPSTETLECLAGLRTAS